MRLKLIVLSTLAVLAGSAAAAPSLQTCSPMEITHSGTGGLSYTMACVAGGWHLDYTGSLPSGNKPVDVQYQLAVKGADGASFTQNRKMRLPSPSHLGQVLVREAALLDNGDLALRECKEMGCTLYRPLGGTAHLAKSTVTVTPELARLREEQQHLGAALEARTQALAQQELAAKALAVDLERSEARLTAALARNAELTAEHAAQMQALDAAHRSTLGQVEVEYSRLAQQTLKLSAELLEQEAGHQLKQRECAQAAVVVTPLPAPVEDAPALRTEVAQLKKALAEKSRRNAELTAEVAQLQTQLTRILEISKPMTDRERETSDSTIARLRAEKVWLQNDVERLTAELTELRAHQAPHKTP